MTIEKNNTLFTPPVKILYAETSDINNIVINPDKSITVNFLTGKDWKLIYSSKNGIKFYEKNKKVNQGVLIEQEISFNFPGDGNENNINIQDLSEKNIIIKLQLINNRAKLIGTVKNPAVLTYEHKSENFVNTRKIKIIRKSETHAPYISS